MDHMDYLLKLEKRLVGLLNKGDESLPLDEFNRVAKEKRETSEKIVLWNAVHGSRMFDVDKI